MAKEADKQKIRNKAEGNQNKQKAVSVERRRSKLKDKVIIGQAELDFFILS